MEVREFINNEILPRVQADGGWIEFGSLSENTLTLIISGDCPSCRSFSRCLDWIRERVKNELQLSVIIEADKRPFIWRT